MLVTAALPALFSATAIFRLNAFCVVIASVYPFPALCKNYYGWLTKSHHFPTFYTPGESSLKQGSFKTGESKQDGPAGQAMPNDHRTLQKGFSIF